MSRYSGKVLFSHWFLFAGAIPTLLNRGEAPTLMGNTRCSGGESGLLQCRSSGLGVRNCPSARQAGVTCLRTCERIHMRL